MSASRSFIGGMNVPVLGAGRLNATTPLASLTIDADGVIFAPRLFARLFARPYRVPFAELHVAYPLRGRVLASGVGLDTRSGQSAYFWTLSQQQEVLESLAAVGVPVDPDPRAARTWSWRGAGGPGAAPAATPWIALVWAASMISTILLVLRGRRSG